MQRLQRRRPRPQYGLGLRRRRRDVDDTIRPAGVVDQRVVRHRPVPFGRRQRAAAWEINVADNTSTPGSVYLFGVGIGPGHTPPGPPMGGLPELFPGPAAPTVTSVSPGSGAAAGGNTVTVTGTGFSGADGVLFGGTPVTGYTIDSDTQMTVTLPPGSGTVDVHVGRGGNVSATAVADQYVYSTGAGPAPLDVIGPTLSMNYGDVVPTLTPTYQGFVNGDTPRRSARPPPARQRQRRRVRPPPSPLPARAPSIPTTRSPTPPGPSR